MTAHYPSVAVANKKRKGVVWNFEKGRERAIKMAALNASKTRIPPPITLPRVKFLEVPFVD